MHRAILQRINALLQAQGPMLQEGAVVDTTRIAATSSTKHRAGKRDPELVSSDESEPRTTKKGKQGRFAMKAHVGVDAASGLIHTEVTTAANVSRCHTTAKPEYATGMVLMYNIERAPDPHSILNPVAPFSSDP